MKEPIGRCPQNLITSRPESPLSRLIADILKERASIFARSNGHTPPMCALANVGGIRSSIPQGLVTIETIYEIAPFDNFVVLLAVPADTMLQMLRHVVHRGGEAISGIEFKTDGDDVYDVRISGNPICKDSVYVMATLDYLAGGGDSFKCLTSCKSVDTGIFFRNMIIDYIRHLTHYGMELPVPTDVRMSIVNDNR